MLKGGKSGRLQEKELPGEGNSIRHTSKRKKKEN